MLKANNSERDIELRKQKDTLITVGGGVMLLAVWNIVKMVGLYLENRQMVNEVVAKGAPTGYTAQQTTWFIAAVLIAVLLITTIGALIQVYVGRTAKSVGMGTNKKPKRLYIVIAVIMVIGSVDSIIAMVANLLIHNDLGIMGKFQTSILVELTMIVLLVALIRAASKIKKLSEDGKHFKK